MSTKNRSYSSPTTHPGVIKPWHQTQSRHWYHHLELLPRQWSHPLIAWWCARYGSVAAMANQCWQKAPWWRKWHGRNFGLNMTWLVSDKGMCCSYSVAQAFKIKKGFFLLHLPYPVGISYLGKRPALKCFQCGYMNELSRTYIWAHSCLSPTEHGTNQTRRSWKY